MPPVYQWLSNALYVLSIVITLISASHIDKARYSIYLKGGICRISDPSDCVIASILRSNNLYKVVSQMFSGTIGSARIADGTPLITRGGDKVAHTNLVLSAQELRHCLGHISLDTAKRLVKERVIEGITLDTLISEMELCTTCVQAKMTWVSFPKEWT